MVQYRAVIGANFGDEGKGHMTDFFVSKMEGDCVVVRFNGGAQSTHTVVLPDGRRHVFSHFGAGSFLYAPTFLSHFFVVEPFSFGLELMELENFGLFPTVMVDEECLVTTPFDVFLNQRREDERGGRAHGSCGIGFNETIVRNEIGQFGLKVGDLRDESIWVPKLLNIKENYYPERLAEICGDFVTFSIDKIIDDFRFFIDRILIAKPDFIVGRNLVFEGAQGLWLDQGHMYYPHVTRSNTGLKNVVSFLNDIGGSLNDLEATYVTRWYLTRHGIGPLPNEIGDLPVDKLQDDTNTFTRYQGWNRAAFLDLDPLLDGICADIKKNGLEKFNLAVTCLDQEYDDGSVRFWDHGELKTSSTYSFIDMMRCRIRPPKLYLGCGKTRGDIVAMLMPGEEAF